MDLLFLVLRIFVSLMLVFFPVIIIVLMMIRNIQKKRKREKLIDKCLEKYLNEDKQNKND